MNDGKRFMLEAAVSVNSSSGLTKYSAVLLKFVIVPVELENDNFLGAFGVQLYLLF